MVRITDLSKKLIKQTIGMAYIRIWCENAFLTIFRRSLIIMLILSRNCNFSTPESSPMYLCPNVHVESR